MPAGTWEHLQDRCDYEIRRLTYMGAGLAGVALYGAGDIGADIFRDATPLRGR
ncbi:hypothetical protein GCM10010493_67450 [Streptomyces lavendulae subsp. grasserius]